MHRIACTTLALLCLAAPALAERLDLPGRSYGGKVRAGPGMAHAQTDSTQLNTPILLLERSDHMDGYDWFFIQLPDGTTGFQWGGLMCAEGEIHGVLTICGSPQDAELSGLAPAPGPEPAPVPSDSPASDVTYSCNEGIPLYVEYRNEGADFVAYASHDGFPPVRLVQIPSGSGLQFESGAYWMGGKGPEMTIDFDGIQDHCWQEH
jgi:membrane-bound inhibitor of C-type lysozyme